MENIIKEIQHFLYWLRCRGSGYKYEGKDVRDFEAQDIGWSMPYTPKHDRVELKTLSTKQQYPNNTCTFEAGTIQKEIDEGVVLSSQSVITKARLWGLLKGNGWASLDGVQEVLKKWGIMKDKDCPRRSNAWPSVSNARLDDAKAAKHKTKSYWNLADKNAILRALDEGKAVTTAIPWYAKFNTRYVPENALLPNKTGSYGMVGWHSVCIIGYDKTKFDKLVFIFKNSYGEEYGVRTTINDNGGVFYLEADYFARQAGAGSRANLDIAVDTGAFIRDYAQKNVRASTGGGIYYIMAGKKRVYPNWFTFLCWNENKKGFIQLDEEETEIMMSLPNGDDMKAESASLFRSHKNKLKDLTSPENLNKILEILNKNV